MAQAASAPLQPGREHFQDALLLIHRINPANAEIPYTLEGTYWEMAGFFSVESLQADTVAGSGFATRGCRASTALAFDKSGSRAMRTSLSWPAEMARCAAINSLSS